MRLRVLLAALSVRSGCVWWEPHGRQRERPHSARIRRLHGERRLRRRARSSPGGTGMTLGGG